MNEKERLEQRSRELSLELSKCESNKMKGVWAAIAGGVLFAGNLFEWTGASNATLGTLALVALIGGVMFFKENNSKIPPLTRTFVDANKALNDCQQKEYEEWKSKHPK